MTGQCVHMHSHNTGRPEECNVYSYSLNLFKNRENSTVMNSNATFEEISHPNYLDKIKNITLYNTKKMAIQQVVKQVVNQVVNQVVKHGFKYKHLL